MRLQRERPRARSILIVASLALVGLAVASIAAAGQAPPAVQPAGLQLASFDAAWSLINERFWDPKFGGVDWQAVRDELRPRAAQAASRGELRLILTEMLSRLGQSHFGIIPGGGDDSRGDRLAARTGASATDDSNVAAASADTAFGALACGEDFDERLLAARSSSPTADSGRPGFDAGLVGAEGLVTRVDDAGPAARAGVRTGWRLLRIGDEPLADIERCLGAGIEARARRLLFHELVEDLLDGEPGESVDLAFGAAGTTRSLTLAREIPSDTQTVRFGNLPPMQFRFSAQRLSPPGSVLSVGLLRWNVWMMPLAEAFERAMVDLHDADGIVIDLRANRGGVAGLSPGVAGYFVDAADSLGTLKYRRDELRLRINPRRVTRDGRPLPAYTGPLAILIDQFSASTSEIFGAGMRDLGRARLFGERSAAAALPAVIERLPNGDFLMHALADLERPSGERIEGVGVSPDEEVLPTPEGLEAGRDEVLDRAMAWIVETAGQGVAR